MRPVPTAPSPAAPQVTPLAPPVPIPVQRVPETVRWSVRSQPPGASVLSEQGELLGQTPLVQNTPRADGTKTVILRLAGYRDAQLSLSLNSDEEREAELVAADGPGRGKGKLKIPGRRGPGKPRAGQGKQTADDTTILLDFKTKKVLKTQ